MTGNTIGANGAPSVVIDALGRSASARRGHHRHLYCIPSGPGRRELDAAMAESVCNGARTIGNNNDVSRSHRVHVNVVSGTKVAVEPQNSQRASQGGRKTRSKAERVGAGA